MGLGLGVLRLPPAQFWAMTPVEFNAAIDACFGKERTFSPLARDELAELMARYPDGSN